MKTTVITFSILVASLFSAHATSTANISKGDFSTSKTAKAKVQKHSTEAFATHKVKAKKSSPKVIDDVMWNRF